MAGHFPVSGSAYFCARQMLGAPIGFLVGWSVVAGGLHLLWLTRGFRRPTPELSLDDGQPV